MLANTAPLSRGNTRERTPPPKSRGVRGEHTDPRDRADEYEIPESTPNQKMSRVPKNMPIVE